jgi:hypothetical protein
VASTSWRTVQQAAWAALVKSEAGGKQGAIAESLGTIESAYPAAKRTEQRASLLAQVVAQRISELQPVLYGSCPDDLGITALSARLKRVNAAINQAVETDRRRQEAEATPRQEKIEECAGVPLSSDRGHREAPLGTRTGPVR